MPRNPRQVARLFILLILPACTGRARRPIPAVASPPPSAATARPEPKPCPSEAPVIDSSCEGFDVGTSCLYAENSVGCSCSEAPGGERGEESPRTRIWRCGEHGELESPE